MVNLGITIKRMPSYDTASGSRVLSTAGRRWSKRTFESYDTASGSRVLSTKNQKSVRSSSIRYDTASGSRVLSTVYLHS